MPYYIRWTGISSPAFCKQYHRKVGAVGMWDAICFDESTDKLFKDRDAIPLMKDYMESGSFPEPKVAKFQVRLQLS